MSVVCVHVIVSARGAHLNRRLFIRRYLDQRGVVGCFVCVVCRGREQGKFGIEQGFLETGAFPGDGFQCR